MSAANIILQREAGFLFSDAAGWGVSGIVGRIASKIHVFPKAHAAITLRGLQPGKEEVSTMLDYGLDFQGLLEFLPVLHRQLAAEAPWWMPTHACGVEISLVAWLQDKGHPGAWRMTSEDPNAPGYDGPVKADGPFECGLSGILDMAPAGDLTGLDLPSTGEEVFALDAITFMLDIAERQRRMLHDPLGSGRKIHIVGGFYEMARVSAVGVERCILRHWPDEVGKRIEVADAVG